VDALVPFPPDVDEEVAVALAVEDDLALHVAVRVGDRGVLREDALEGVAPGV
jgi:hypothetical protein